MDSSTKIDVEYEVETGSDDALTFQDIPHSIDDSKNSKTHEFTNFPHSALDSDEEIDGDNAKLLKDDKDKAGSSSSFWTFAYYQQFFDVETKQVGARIIGSMLPRPGSNYLIKQIRPKPDLYGPFWICTTLVFTTAIAGNLANYFSAGGKNYHWKYDFHKVTFASTAIFSYWWFIPLILSGLLWWRGNKNRFTFLEILCLYGYSLAIYIPISVLWAIQISWLQWTLVIVGAVLSGSVLLMNFWPVVSEDNKKIAMGIMIFIFIMHAALAVGFVLYFFYVPAQSTSITPANNTTHSPVTEKPVVQNPDAVNDSGNKRSDQIVENEASVEKALKKHNESPPDSTAQQDKPAPETGGADEKTSGPSQEKSAVKESGNSGIQNSQQSQSDQKQSQSETKQSQSETKQEGQTNPAT